MNHASCLVCTLLPALACAPAVRAEPPKLPVPAVDQSAVAQRGYFYVGGKYVGEPGKEIMQGQIYVEVLAPKDVRRPYPLVLIHGAAQTATNWMGTPDGRKGWAEYFVEQGYVVYMIDQPMRGRSAEHPSDGPTRMFTVANEERQFTASESSEGTWPQAKKHTQWPGDGPNKGKKGDPIFDAFYATQVETVISNEETQSRNRDAGAALLDKIGPAIVLTHSQSGSFGWLIADARPRLVKAIVAIEPAGPPFENTINGTGKGRAWGPTDIAITYDPPVADPGEIAVEREAKADGPDLFVCWVQKAPARRLVNLAGIPVMVMSAEASYHQVYDHCTAKYLAQAGVRTEHIRLQDRGIHGNGHMVMIEKNNLDIARCDWLEDEISGWRMEGIDIVVSLLDAAEVSELSLQQEAHLCEKYAMEFISFPIPDRGVPASPREAATLTSLMAFRISEGKAVAVHCRAGIGRSSLIAACVLVSSGSSPEAAFEIIGKARGLSVPDTEGQRNWVVSFKDAIATAS